MFDEKGEDRPICELYNFALTENNLHHWWNCVIYKRCWSKLQVY